MKSDSDDCTEPRHSPITMKTNSLKRAVIYCRVSTKEQVEEGGSLATQEKICTEYADKNGYEIVKAYIEKGESAKNADRTQLTELLAFCTSKKNNIQAVITYKLDRLARNTDDYRQIRYMLRRQGVEIKSTSEYFEDTPAGRFMESILSNVAQFDNDVRTERCVNGMRDALREGRFVWCAPPGYDNGRVNGKPNLVPNAVAPFVVKAFEMVAQNVLPRMAIYKKLTKEGLLNGQGRPVVFSQFNKMLANELYAGWIVGLGERNKGAYAPLITEELFARVQAILRGRKYPGGLYKRDSDDFPLRRFVSHPLGRKLTGCWSQGRRKKYPYYKFPIKGMVFPRDEFHRSFRRYYDKFRLTDAQFEKLKLYVWNGMEQSNVTLDGERESAKKRIAVLKSRQSALVQKNLDGVISDAILKEQLDGILGEIQQATVTLAQPHNISRKDLEVAFVQVEDYLKNPSAVWEKAPLSRKLLLQRFTFPLGITFDGKKFQTSKIAFVYNPCEEIWCLIYIDVNPKFPSSNTPDIPTSENWREIARQILELAAILTSAHPP